MEIFFILLTILGLSLFEIITSIDNAVINADVLSGMGQKARRWFLTWGLFFAVIVVRGLFPFIIIWITVPSLGPIDVLGVAFNGSPVAKEAIEKASPVLLMGGGMFLVFLFLNWLFMQPKNFGLKGEKFFQGQGAWFFAIVSVLLLVIVWFSLKVSSIIAFSAVVGSTAFFIIHGFQQYAEAKEKRLLDKRSKVSDVSKVIYLEILDATFSLDGVIGAFAFTLFIPLILIGNGLGALFLRKLTISNIDRIRNYRFLKNGAMYSILFLGTIMIVNAFGFHLPTFISPIITFTIVGYFFYKSRLELKKVGKDIAVVMEAKNNNE